MPFFRIIMSSALSIMLTPLALQAEDAKETEEQRRARVRRESQELLKRLEKPVVRSYRMNRADYVDLKDIIQAQLSEKGKANYVNSVGKLLVIDIEDGQKRIKAIIDEIKGATRYNISVTVNYNSLKTLQAKGIKIHTGPLVIEHGKVKKPDRVDIVVDGRNNRKEENSAINLTVYNGGEASLWATKTSLDPAFIERWVILDRFGRALTLDQKRQFQREVGMTMRMKAKHIGEGIIEVTVFPQLTVEEGKGHRKRYTVQGVETKVMVANGRTIPLGGTAKSMDDFFSSVFNPTGAGKVSTQDLLDISLTATLMEIKPPQQRPQQLPQRGPNQQRR